MTLTTACARCGQPVKGGERFCSNCGADVSAEQSGAATRRFTPISTTVAAHNELLARLRRAALGEYEILVELGRGGMASVFLAHDIQLDRKVAIKVMLPQLVEGEGMAERFKLEARTAAGLSHAHIIPIYAVRETDLLVYFVMKFVEGRPLDTMLREIGPAPLPMVRSIITKVGDALGYAHRRGVVHRDIKPANLMIDTEGQPVVTDFGIAKVAAAAGLTMTGATIGTPAYMSPEQASSKPLTGASDQYSLGVVAYQMLTGHLPFQADNMVSLMYMHCHEPAPSFRHERPDCPPELHDAVMRMLEKDPADRFPDLESAVEAIGRVQLSHSDPVQTQLVDLAKRGGNRHLLDQVKTPRSPIVTRSRRTATDPDAASAPTTPSGPRTPAPGLTSGQLATQPQTIVVQQSSAPWIITIGVVIAAAAGAIWFVTRGNEQGGPPAITQAPATSGVAPGAGADPGARRADPAGAGDGADPAAVPAPTTGVAATTPATGGPAAPNPSAAQRGGPTAAGAEARPGSRPAPSTPAGPNVAAPAPVAPPRVISVSVAPSGRALDPGATLRLSADLATADGRPATDVVSWRSSAPAVATVNDGVVTAVAPGTAAIIASAGGVDGSATVRVNAPVAAEPPPSAPAPPAGTPARNAREEIAAAVDAYVRALESRQISELRRVYPAMSPEQEQQLSGALRAMEQLDVTMDVRSLDIRGTSATAMVSGTYDFFSRDSRRRERLPVNVQMTLEQGASGWLIRQIRSVR